MTATENKLVCECPGCQGTGRNVGSQAEGGCEDCHGERVVSGVHLGTLGTGRRFYLDGWEVYMTTDIGQDTDDEFTWTVSVKTGRGVRLNNGYVVRTV